MKKFISGALVGATLASTVALAGSYIAEPASFKVMVNGKEFASDPPVVVVEGYTYLPLRAMGDALGVPVNWNAELNQAEVGYNYTLDSYEVQNYIIGEVWNRGFWYLRNYLDGSYVYYTDNYINDFADSYNEEFDINKIINNIINTKSTIEHYNTVYADNEAWQNFYKEYNRLYELVDTQTYTKENFDTTYFVKVRDAFCDSI